MICELKELDMNMGKKEYEMFQDIPSKEAGSTNLCKGLPFKVFSNFIESQLQRKINNISIYDTPTTTYIFYIDQYPVGYICLRTQIDEKWEKWSGNIYYTIRLKERKKGYGTLMLKELLSLCKKNGTTSLLAQSCKGNLASSKTIEKNNGIFLAENNGTKYYRFDLKFFSPAINLSNNSTFSPSEDKLLK